CRLALAYSVAQRTDDARRVLDELSARGGGTYSDRIVALWAESLVDAQLGGDARASVDAAHAIATATEARVEQAVSAIVRAGVLSAVGDPDAGEVRADAETQLATLGLQAGGWRRLVDLALAGVRTAPAG
ncbi:MAG TPA: hypothetical protein VN636_12635, partial [Acidimicrobiia bacterium]|nr:hypothetical protein [Acidimicrobiia bacterium]